MLRFLCRFNVMGNLFSLFLSRRLWLLCGTVACATLSGCEKKESAGSGNREEQIIPIGETIPTEPPLAVEEEKPMQAEIKPEPIAIPPIAEKVLKAFERDFEAGEAQLEEQLIAMAEQYGQAHALQFIKTVYQLADDRMNAEFAYIAHLRANAYIASIFKQPENVPDTHRLAIETLRFLNDEAYRKKHWTLALSGYRQELEAYPAGKNNTEAESNEVTRTISVQLRLAVIYLNTQRPEEALNQIQAAKPILVLGTAGPMNRVLQIEAYYLAALAHSERGEAVEVLAAVHNAMDILNGVKIHHLRNSDTVNRGTPWLWQRLQLLQGRAYIQLKQRKEAYTSLTKALPTPDELEAIIQDLPAQEALELADYFGFYAEAADSLGKTAEAATALENKLVLESAAIEKSFRVGNLEGRVRRTRNQLTELYLRSGKTEQVAAKLAERVLLQSEQFLKSPPNSKQLNEWLETLGQLARARLAAGQIPQMAMDFASALAMADALVMATQIEPASEMAALPFEVELLQLDCIESFLSEHRKVLSAIDVTLGRQVELLDDAAIDLQERIATRLRELAENTTLSFPARSRVVRVLLRRGDRLMQDDLREALYTYQQARHFVSPEADQLYVEMPALRAAILLRIGTIQEKRADFANARTSLTSALDALLQMPATERKKSPDTLETLALTHHQLGRLHKAEGELDNARQQFAEALDIAKTLWDTGGADLEKSSNLATLYSEAAEVALHFSQFKEVRELLLKEQELRHQLARYPTYNTPASQLALLKNYRVLAECAEGLHDWEECRNLLAVAKRALARVPDTQLKSLVWNNERLRIAELSGIASLEDENKTAALEEWNAALAQPLGEPGSNSKRSAIRQRELAASIWERIASTEESMGNLSGASEALLQAFQRVSDNQPVFTPDAPPRMDPRSIAGRISNLFARRNQTPEALRFALIERDYLDTLMRQFPRHPVFILELQRINEKAAQFALQQNLHTEARDYIDEALALNNALLQRSPSDSELQQDRDRLNNLRSSLPESTP